MVFIRQTGNGSAWSACSAATWSAWSAWSTWSTATWSAATTADTKTEVGEACGREKAEAQMDEVELICPCCSQSSGRKVGQSECIGSRSSWPGGSSGRGRSIRGKCPADRQLSSRVRRHRPSRHRASAERPRSSHRTRRSVARLEREKYSRPIASPFRTRPTLIGGNYREALRARLRRPPTGPGGPWPRQSAGSHRQRLAGHPH